MGRHRCQGHQFSWARTSLYQGLNGDAGGRARDRRRLRYERQPHALGIVRWATRQTYRRPRRLFSKSTRLPALIKFGIRRFFLRAADHFREINNRLDDAAGISRRGVELFGRARPAAHTVAPGARTYSETGHHTVRPDCDLIE